MKKLLFLIPCIFFNAQLMAQDLQAEEIISRNLAAIGQEKLMNIRTIKTTGTMNMQGMEIRVSAIEKNPSSTRQEMEIQGITIVMVLDGETGWMINPMSGSPDPQDLPEEMIINLTRAANKEPSVSWDHPFVNRMEKGIKTELIGTEELDGKPVYNLKLTFQENYVINYYVDASEFVVLKTRSTEMAQGQTYDSEVKFSDYKNFDGILCPGKIEFLVNGQVTQFFIMDNIEFDLPVDDSVFKKPGKQQE